MCILTISLFLSNSSAETNSTTSFAASLGYRSKPKTLAPKPLNNFASVRPIFPVPYTPTVQFLISLLNISGATLKSFSLVRSSVNGRFLSKFIANITASSAIALGEYLGTLATLISKSLAASKSM